MGTRLKRFLTASLAALALLTTPALALPETLIPMGCAVGIRVETDGVMVIALSQVDCQEGPRSPASDCGIRPGDVIRSIGASPVTSADDFRAVMAGLDGGEISVTVCRDGRELQLLLTPRRNRDGVLELGIWLRDGISGIGTLTFIDPATGLFGALGHPVNDIDTGVLLPLRQGCVRFSGVCGIKKGVAGSPGELTGSFDFSHPDGELLANTPRGIFGAMAVPTDAEALPVAGADEIRLGAASILANIEGFDVKEYSVEISRVYPDSPSRSLMLTVTDPQLLAATGGIVQGMSGSPILQNGKLIGAVTHVLVNSPDKGYGISIEAMLEAAAQLPDTDAA